MQGNTAGAKCVRFNSYQTNFENAYHNTKLLLEKYRRIAIRLKYNMNRLDAALHSDLHQQMDELKQMMERQGMTTKEAQIPDMAFNCNMTLKMLDIMAASLEILREDPDHGEDYYWVLQYSYIVPKPIRPTEALIGCLEEKGIFISRAYYFELKKRAIQALGDIIWGYMSNEVVGILKYYQDWLTENNM